MLGDRRAKRTAGTMTVNGPPVEVQALTPAKSPSGNLRCLLSVPWYRWTDENGADNALGIRVGAGRLAPNRGYRQDGNRHL
jgi:hypothetical protein